MRDLRTIRIFISVLFFAAAVGYLFIGSGVTSPAAIAKETQIVPSALVMTMGAAGFWLVATFVLGRVYCSTVCQVGTLQDSATWLRRRLMRLQMRRRRAGRMARKPMLRPYSYRIAGRWRGLVLLAYVVCLLLGLIALATLIEPWNMMRSAARFTNSEANASWLIFAGESLIGAVVGDLMLAIVWIWALLRGRAFCTEVCPIGTVLGTVSRFSLYQIEIDPDRCTNCMRCEEVCKTSGIKVAERFVDNERCVRCFDCLKVCSDDAIRLQRNRNQRVNPLMKPTVKS